MLLAWHETLSRYDSRDAEAAAVRWCETEDDMPTLHQFTQLMGECQRDRGASHVETPEEKFSPRRVVPPSMSEPAGTPNRRFIDPVSQVDDEEHTLSDEDLFRQICRAEGILRSATSTDERRVWRERHTGLVEIESRRLDRRYGRAPVSPKVAAGRQWDRARAALGGEGAAVWMRQPFRVQLFGAANIEAAITQADDESF